MSLKDLVLLEAGLYAGVGDPVPVPAAKVESIVVSHGSGMAYIIHGPANGENLT